MRDVWTFPRPPAIEPCARRVRIELGGRLIAESARALEVLETSHPPTVYVPVADFSEGVLARSSARSTFCEFKGHATYFDVLGERAAAWGYESPSPGYEALVGHVAVYPGRMDACFLGDERVQPQEGDFYGGWVTADIKGPIKGAPGTRGW